MLEGSCLCGSIAYHVEKLVGPIGHCHCRTCRKAHSAAYATTASVLRDHFSWTQGEEFLRAYESSPGKLRHFCVRCGTQLIAEWIDKPNVILRLGSLDVDPGQKPIGHIWVSHDVPWMCDAEDLPRLQQGLAKE